MKFVISLFAWVFIISQVFGQDYSLCGRAIADESDILLPYTSIYLIQNKDTIRTLTDYSGKYKFENLKSGVYKLHAKNDQRFLYDTITNILTSFAVFDIRMKTFNPPVFEKTKHYEFKYHKAPTSHSNYEYIIRKDSLFLNQRKLIDYKKNKKLKRKAVYRSFSYAFKESEQKILDSLVKSNKLDLIGTYEDRVLVSGWHWDIEIERQGVNFKINLPNYHNQGLEEIFKYVLSFVPKEEKFKWTR